MRISQHLRRCLTRAVPLLGLSAVLLAGCIRQATQLDPDELIRRGWERYRLGDFDLTVSDFDDALAAVPEGDSRRPMILYGLGTVWNLRTPVTRQKPDLAASFFRQAIEADPNGKLAAWSALALARVQHLVPVGREPDYPKVRKAYQDVIDRYPGHLAADEAFIYLQSTVAATMEVQASRQAVRDLEHFIETHPQSGFLNAAYALLAVCYETLNDPERRLAAEIRAIDTKEIDASNPKQENSWEYWKIATIADFEVGDFPTARRFYRRLIEEYPQDVRRFAAEHALERMDEIERKLAAAAGTEESDGAP